MPYTAPNRDVLRTALARDLRDPDLETFTSDELNDLLNHAIVEVSRVYPKEETRSLVTEQDEQNQFAIDAITIFRVELLDEEGVVKVGVPPSTLQVTYEDGYDLHGGILFLPTYVAQNLRFEDGQTIRVWGYFPRELFEDDTAAFDGDAEAEWAVRTYANLEGYQRLQNDRLLFQQWLTNTGNTDVSPNQLAQTADMYRSQWRETRNRIRSLQRT